MVKDGYRSIYLRFKSPHEKSHALKRTASAGLYYLLIVPFCLYLKCFKLQILMKADLQSSQQMSQHLNLSGACGVKIRFCKIGPKYYCQFPLPLITVLQNSLGSNDVKTYTYRTLKDVMLQTEIVGLQNQHLPKSVSEGINTVHRLRNLVEKPLWSLNSLLDD